MERQTFTQTARQMTWPNPTAAPERALRIHIRPAGEVLSEQLPAC